MAKIIGSLTDGDIRSALIKNNNLDRSIIDIYNKDFKYVRNKKRQQWSYY